MFLTTVKISCYCSVAKSSDCDPMDCSMPGSLILHSLTEFAQIHVLWVGVILSNHLILCTRPASPFAFNLPWHQGLLQWVSSLHQMAKVLELQFQSFQWVFRTVFLSSPCSLRDSQESSPASQIKGINSSALSLLYGPTLTSAHDYWKNHSFDYVDLCWQSNVSAF